MRVTSNASDKDDRLLDDLKHDSSFISESLSGEGYPSGWNPSTVEKLGLTDGRLRVNGSKVLYAAAINYTSLKMMLGTKHDFYVFFKDKDGNVLNLGVCGFGGLSLENSTQCQNISVNSKMLVKSERLVYNDGVVNLVVYSWRS